MQEPEHLCKLFIGGLDYRTTDDNLKSHFEQYGEIVDVIVMKDPQTKRSRGFGFVAFSQSYMVDDAQSNRPHVIDGRTVDTKRAVPRDEIGRSNGQVKKLFVGGIKDASEEVLRETFSQFGDVVSISIPVERETQKKRGFAFIEFSDADAADKAALQKEIIVNDTRVDVKKARDKNENQRGGGGGGRGGYGNQGGYGGGYGGGQGGYGGGQGGYGGGGYGGGQGGGQWGGQQGGGGGQWGGGYGGDGSSSGGWGGQSGGGGSDFGNNYSQSYGGGPTRGQGNYYQNNRSAPYSGGSQGGYNMGSSGGSGNGYSGYNSGKRQ